MAKKKTKKKVKDSVNPLPGRVFVTDMKYGERKIGSIIIMNDDGRDQGVRPRWAQIWKVGEGVTEVAEKEWVLIEHGRWSRKHQVGDITFWAVELESIMLATTTEPNDEQLID